LLPKHDLNHTSYSKLTITGITLLTEGKMRPRSTKMTRGREDILGTNRTRPQWPNT